jgi:hypothetical protein
VTRKAIETETFRIVCMNENVLRCNCLKTVQNGWACQHITASLLFQGLSVFTGTYFNVRWACRLSHDASSEHAQPSIVYAIEPQMQINAVNSSNVGEVEFDGSGKSEVVGDPNSETGETQVGENFTTKCKQASTTKGQ